MKKFKDKTVLITGAARGLGKLLAYKFADEGSKLILLDINKEGLKNLKEEITKKGITVYDYYCDLSKKNDIYHTADSIKNKIGAVDILINNAGIVTGRSFLECPDELIEKTMQVNISAHFWIVKSFLPDMIKRNSGHLVTVSSAAGIIGTAGLADYCASKFAAFGFHESVRMELKKNKSNRIKTTIICPFFINTGMFDGVKSKVGFLLPILDENKAAKKIFNAIKRNRQILVMPRFAYTVPILRMLPVSMLDFVVRLLGVDKSMDSFKGRN